jgi:hypothetical protein
MVIFAGYGGPTSPSFVPDALTTLRKVASSSPISVSTAEAPKEVSVAHLMTAFRLEVGCANYSGYVAGTSYWKIVLEASIDMVAANFKPIGECVLKPQNATDFSIRSEILTNGVIAQSVVPGAKYLRCNAVKVGTPGVLNYNAYMSPIGPLGA